MKIAQVQFATWDKIYSFSLGGHVLAEVNDFVIVDTELGKEIGRIVSFVEKNDNNLELKPVLSLASDSEVRQVFDKNKRQEALDSCQKLIHQHNLKMKLIDARFSLTANRLTFAFVADNRIDFRDLVKDLSSTFNLNVRLFQIGSRDQARCQGDCGPCGLSLCCRSFVRDFSSVTSDMAEAQQVVHRGSDRISGMCGRLMCCLSFEYEGYKDLAKELPVIGEKIKVEGKVGTIIGRHILKQSLDVRFVSDRHGERDLILRVDLKQLNNNLNKEKNFKKKR